MDNLTLKEEMQILNAAKLAGDKAPENLNNRRSREFVHGQLNAGKPRKWSVLKSPATYVAFALAACVAIVLMVVGPDSDSQQEVLQQDKIHAAYDSVDVARDSLEAVVLETIEIAVIDE